ncbi:bifunctional riboflavin kinase/FAD synthetase [Pikeienuella piscinae]|uniref:Riboflavin biosynthesis protein n=1 Tax=Pikeienuella piscinae TaxID=2748098 RepID=A0A7L5BXH6_9RHOB|nr:bifunctional riboflavin kinase/FAD synthetase [Pikeienuella piscinae]QIE55227.1 bifunctional riboflavin kinase/FAD synthetase [Pikeienuella piscinae]
MRIIEGLESVRAEDRGASAAIGNFDGVHRGHQAVLDLARGRGPLGVVTFEPHPREVFQPDAPPFRLMRLGARADRLAALGVERLFVIRFDRDFARLGAEAFCADVLAGKLGLSHVVVGADFRFGAKRAGDAAVLREAGARLGFDVTVAELLAAHGEEVSSTAIRLALSEGRVEDATRMLGHLHRIEGEVEHGAKRGRELGYPTINQSLDGLMTPRFGVYAARVEVKDGPHKGAYDGVASLGVRPMFGENRPNLETYLFDFSGDLYGARVSTGLVSWRRPELKFEGTDALIAAMKRDEADARRLLAAQEAS